MIVGTVPVVIACAVMLWAYTVDSVRNQPYISDTELIDCTKAIFAADDNSFPDNEINYTLTPRSRLFHRVNEARLRTGVYPSFRFLLQNFNPQLGEADDDLTEEINHFLDKVIDTGPLEEVYKCVQDYGFVHSRTNFRELLMEYWFLKFSRRGGKKHVKDSSGFEHTFQGEIKGYGRRKKLTGWHSWIRTYDTETERTFVHHNSNDCGNNLIKMQGFKYKDARKQCSTIWIGKSPELQFALYSVCFMTRQEEEKCNISFVIDGNDKYYTINSFKWNRPVQATTIGGVYFNC